MFCVFAHSGGTDKKGGHHDRSYGGYHFHHGNPSHQHIDGVCELTMNRDYSSFVKNLTKKGADYGSLVIVGIIGLGAGYFLRNPKM